MIQQQPDDLQSPKEDDADKLFMEDGSSLQSPDEETAKKDNYYEVDEKKLVVSNIGDGTPHDEGLAGEGDDEPDQQD